MSDYISRQAAIEAIANEVEPFVIVEPGTTCVIGTGVKDADVFSKLESLPSADVAPVIHGTLLPIVSYNNTYKCSECGRLLVDITDGLKMVAKHYPYCHCGAKMDEEERAG